MQKEEYESLIENIQDFPKQGVVFKDIFPLLEQRLECVVDDLAKGVDWNEIDLILGIESRGFILASAMALKLGKGFVPIRKKGKLPPPTVHASYDLEYGSDTIEMRVNNRPLNVVIVDDVLATGGTMRAAMSLCEKNNMRVHKGIVLIDLQFLNDLRDDHPIYSVLQY